MTGTRGGEPATPIISPTSSILSTPTSYRPSVPTEECASLDLNGNNPDSTRTAPKLPSQWMIQDGDGRNINYLVMDHSNLQSVGTARHCLWRIRNKYQENIIYYSDRRKLLCTWESGGSVLLRTEVKSLAGMFISIIIFVARIVKYYNVKEKGVLRLLEGS
jgi:hypothetical protein